MSKKSDVGENEMIDSSLLAMFEQAVTNIDFGSVTLIVQNSRVIQIEKLEKIRIPYQHTTNSRTVKTDKDQLRAQLNTAIRDLQFGQVVILIKDGQVSQIERIQKQRVQWVEGRHGDGI